MAEFIPRSQQEIVDALLAYAISDPDISSEVMPSDLNVGGLERARTESLALHLEESDLRVLQAVRWTVSEACFTAFGFGLLPAQKAIGGEVFSTFTPAVDPIPIPTGSEIMGPSGVIFETTAPSSIPAGELTSASVPIRAKVAGSRGNVAAGSLTKLVTPIAGVDMVTNPSRCAGGTDGETEDARAVRFAAFLRTLVRGTKEALEFAALSASAQVQDARAIEPFMLDPVPQGVPFAGLVWLFVDDGTAALDLDAGVASEVSKLVEGYVNAAGVPVPGYKAAGTKVEIRKVTRVPVMVRGGVSLHPGGTARWAAIQEALTAAASEYFSRLRVGEKASYQNLTTFLEACDADVAEVDLAFWTGSTPPAYSAPLSAEDITFYDPSNAASVGSRGDLFDGVAPGPSSASVVYPEWRLV